jgi:hypothetical protein
MAFVAIIFGGRSKPALLHQTRHGHLDHPALRQRSPYDIRFGKIFTCQPDSA